MTKKRSTQSLLAGQNNEIDFPRRKIETERTNRPKERLRLENEKLIIKINKEVQANKALTEELSNKKANNDAHMKQMEQELDNNKMTNNTLLASNNKLKRELDKEKLSNKCLQANNDKLNLVLDQQK